MIIREWRGRARPSLAGAYVNHFHARVIPELAAVPGFRGACLMQRRAGDFVEFLVLTRWASMEAIRGFAGADVEKAVIEPAAERALSSFDAHVRHYEIVEEIASEARAAEAEDTGAEVNDGTRATTIVRAVLVSRN